MSFDGNQFGLWVQKCRGSITSQHTHTFLSTIHMSGERMCSENAFFRHASLRVVVVVLFCSFTTTMCEINMLNTTVDKSPFFAPTVSYKSIPIKPCQNFATLLLQCDISFTPPNDIIAQIQPTSTTAEQSQNTPNTPSPNQKPVATVKCCV